MNEPAPSDRLEPARRGPLRSLALVAAVLAANHCSAKTPSAVGDAGAPTPAASASGLSSLPTEPAEVRLPPATAERALSGLASQVLVPGHGGAHPTPWDVVQLRYAGWTPEGAPFFSPDAYTLFVPAAPDGWEAALALMVEGEKRRLWVPAAASQTGAPAGNTVMDVELLRIDPRPKPPPAPKDVASPSGRARRTGSGVAYEILSTGGAHAPRPGPDAVVAFNVTSWTPDGALLASSYPDGQPLTAVLADLWSDWREALQLLHVGDKARFWFPTRSEAAAANPPTDRQEAHGPMVCDIELLYAYAMPGLSAQ